MERILKWLTFHAAEISVFIVTGFLAVLIGYSVYGWLNPPQPVTSISQEKAETVQGVKEAAANAEIPLSVSQAKEVVEVIREIRTTEQVPVYVVQTTGQEVRKESEKALEESGADFSIVTVKGDKDNPSEETVDLDNIPKETKIELNQYNVNAYKKQLNTIGYTPREQVVEYVHSWKVSKDGNYLGVGIAQDLDDNRTYVKFTYTW